MKKYFIGLGMILLVANGAMAQSKKGDFEVNASWGYLSMPEIDGIASTAFSYLATLGTYCSDNKSFTGAIAVAGKYYVTNRINVGLALTYEQEKREMLEDAVRLREAGVIARKGLLWFAGTIAALTTIWMAMQKMYELAAAYLKSRGV